MPARGRGDLPGGDIRGGEPVRHSREESHDHAQGHGPRPQNSRRDVHWGKVSFLFFFFKLKQNEIIFLILGRSKR